MRNLSGLLLLIIISSTILFFNLGVTPLLDPDEPVYAETPREMLVYGDFVSPRIYGEYWYDKPPMYYWLVAASFKVFGINEFAARFPSALLALGCILAVYAAGRRLLGERAGLTGAFILATGIEFWYLGKAAVTDITLTLCLTLSLLGFIEKRYYFLYVFAALATLTKGPVGFLFPGAIICLYLLFTRKFSVLKEMRLLPGTALFLVIALPWYWSMYQIHGQIFLDTFLGFHNLTRFTSPEHPEGALWYYYIPVFVAGFFPWIAVFPQAVYRALWHNERETRRILLFLVIWTLFIFAFFSISQTKLVSYILPMFPPAALLAGWYIDDLAGRLWCQERSWGWIGLLVVLCALLIVTVVTGGRLLPVMETGAVLVAALLAAVCGVAVYFLWRRRIYASFAVQVGGMLLFVAILMTSLLPAAAPYFSSKDLAAQFSQVYDGRSSVYIMKILHPGFTFYSGLYGQEIDKEEVGARIRQEERSYFVIRDLDYQRLTSEELQRVQVLVRDADKLVLLKP